MSSRLPGEAVQRFVSRIPVHPEQFLRGLKLGYGIEIVWPLLSVIVVEPFTASILVQYPEVVPTTLPGWVLLTRKP